MTKRLVQGLLGSMALMTATAQAGLITVDAVPFASEVKNVAIDNDFRVPVSGFGVTNYTLGASLATDVAGSVTYYYYGKEAGYSNQFQAAGGVISHTTGFSSFQNNFAAPLNLGSVSVGTGLLNFQFCAFTGPAASGNCVTNADNDALRHSSERSIAMRIVDNSAWLFWDDSGAGPDDDYDDMLIRVVFTPIQVPEPATVVLLGLGLIFMRFAARQRRRRIPAVSK